jgi:hypothetical protein
MNGLVPEQSRAPRSGNQALGQQVKPESAATSPTPRQLTAEQQAVMDRVQHKANIIRDVAFPAAMAGAIPVAKDVGTAAFKVYRDGLLREAGSPTDPVEVMLIEQLALAHHRIAQLHVQAEQAKGVEESKVYTMAAVRLTGELRRLALTLSQYRQPVPKRQFTLIKQQHLSRAGQQIAYLDRGNESQSQIPCDGGGGKLGSTAARKIGSSPARYDSVSPEQQRLTATE